MDEFSIWLLPAAAQQTRLSRTIERLSAALGGQRFAPHVTIQGDLDMSMDRLQGALGPLAAGLGRLRWRVARVEHSEFYFRCLVLRFGAEPAFDALQLAAQAVSGTASGLSPYPHLSLAYGPPHPDKPLLCEQLSREFVGQEMLFDRIAVCRASSRLPIDTWTCLAQYALAP
jgi:hypothetical protein